MTHDEIRNEIARRLQMLDEKTVRTVLEAVTDSIIHHIYDGCVHESVDCLGDILDDLDNQGIDPLRIDTL